MSALFSLTKTAAFKPEPRELYRSERLGVGTHPVFGEMEVCYGLSREHIAQLEAYVADTEDASLQKNTNDAVRFGSGGFAEYFTKKERYVFALVQKEDNTLAAVIWYGPKEVPENIARGTTAPPADQPWDTMSFRTYPHFRGTGVTSEFSRFLLALWEEHRVGRGLWLIVQKDNTPAVALYKKLDFVVEGELPEQEKYWMVYEPK